MQTFRRWYTEAVDAGEVEPDAVSLATVDGEGAPSVRYVLLKGFDDRGFVFYTNLASRKSGHLALNPRAALAWRWRLVDRQVRAEGSVVAVEPAEADAYFASRPRGSQLGAWASRQSQVIEDRSQLDEQLAEVDKRFAGGEVPRPPFWGGYRLIPTVVEFWSQGEFRLHDRLQYSRRQGEWVIERLSP